MPFTPRTRDEIAQEAGGQVVAQSDLSDLSEGSVMLSLVGAFAEALEAVEFRIKVIRDSYDWNNAVGEDLDERAADLPRGGVVRLRSAPAAGSAVVFGRDPTATASPLNIQPGTVVGRSDNPDLLYQLVEAVTLGVGVDTSPPSRVVALTPGVVGNAPVGTIDRLVRGAQEIISVTQPVALSGGINQESDADLRSRMGLYVAGLARSQPSALEFLGRTYVATDGTRARFAFVFEDLANPALSELVLDDGNGLQGLETSGALVTGVIPVNGTTRLHHQGPATDVITKIKVTKSGGGPTSVLTDPTDIWVSAPERGIITLLDGQTAIEPGDTWTVGDVDTPYKVFTGIVAEVQQIVEGSPDDGYATLTGYRAAGTRVRVLPPTPYDLAVTVNLVLLTGVDAAAAVEAAEAVITDFFLALGPGDTFYLSQFYSQLQASLAGQVEALTVLTPDIDFPAPTARSSLRAGSILVT